MDIDKMPWDILCLSAAVSLIKARPLPRVSFRRWGNLGVVVIVSLTGSVNQPVGEAEDGGLPPDAPALRGRLAAQPPPCQRHACKVGWVFSAWMWQVLHRMEETNKHSSPCEPKDQEANKCYGGVARVATAVTTMKAEDEVRGGESQGAQGSDAVLWINGGDFTLTFIAY